MPSQLIDFGAATYPSTKSQSELNPNMMNKIIDGYINELKHYVKRKGLTLFATQGTSSWDALYRVRGLSTIIVIGVTNGVFYRINAGGTVTAFTGSTATVGNPISFTEDVAHVFAAHGNRIIRLDVDTLVATTLTGGNSPTNVTQIAYLDGFLACNGAIGGGGVPGDLNFSDDFTGNYEAADSWEVFNNEALGDSCTAVASQWQELFCFGPESMEASFDDGDTPFARIDGAVVPYGIVAPWSLLNIDNTLYYIGRVDGANRLLRVEGRRPIVVSENYDKELQQFTLAELALARAFYIVDDGKPFYCIQLGGSAVDKTLAFNLRTRTWSEFARWQGVAATGTLTSTGVAPADGAQVEIGFEVYIFRTTLVQAYDVLIGVSAATALDNLKSAINHTAGEGTTYGTGTIANALVSAGTNTDTTQQVTALSTGLGGNNISTTEASSVLSWGAVTLAGGTDVYTRFIGQCSVWWPEEKKMIVGSRLANGKLYTYGGGTDDGDILRMQLESNLHDKGNSHKKGTGRIVFDSAGGSFKFQFREPPTAYDDQFIQVETGYFTVNRLGEYIARQYMIVHDSAVEDFVLNGAEEWFEVRTHG